MIFVNYDLLNKGLVQPQIEGHLVADNWKKKKKKKGTHAIFCGIAARPRSGYIPAQIILTGSKKTW